MSSTSALDDPAIHIHPEKPERPTQRVASGESLPVEHSTMLPEPPVDDERTPSSFYQHSTGSAHELSRVTVDVEDDEDELGLHAGAVFNPYPGIPRDGSGYGPYRAHEADQEKEVKRGTVAEAKQLYEGPKKCTCCINWVEVPTRSSDKHTTKAKWGQYAVVVRKTSHGGDKPWAIDNVTINSSHILAILRKHLADYPGLALAAEEVVFKSPFAPLLHFWANITRDAQTEDDPTISEHFATFREVMQPELEPHIQKVKDCIKHGKIEFHSLWTLFKPGCFLHWKQNGVSNVGRLIECTTTKSANGSPTLDLLTEQVDFDGNTFGYNIVVPTISWFDGHKAIAELPAPLDMRSDCATIKEAMIKRGRKFQDLKGFHFKAYHGNARINSGNHVWSLRSLTQIVTSRVVIDASAYYSHALSSQPQLTPLRQAGIEATASTSAVVDSYMTPYYHPGSPEDAAFAQSAAEMIVRVNEPAEISTLTEVELMLCVSSVRGFLLTDKAWCTLDVDNIEDINWGNPFDNLVLPNQVKDLLLAFAKTKTSGDVIFDDFVGGKGKGMIMMLSGPPGVGKTLTAEAIAEKLKVPVYSLSAGELGTVPPTMEAELLKAMQISCKWNAVLLLDECDVFLEKRELNSLKRNELVSIFLRLVEYYEGIMVLTTNRISTIDPAFNSRIDVAIAYDDLTTHSRRQIWDNFIKKLRSDGAQIDDTIMTDITLGNLAQNKLNGRQIKSVIKTAQLLAVSKEQPLGTEHLEAVLNLNKERT